MAKFTVTQTAKVISKTRQTVHRYIKEGKLSSTIDGKKIHHIDESEIGRVFNIKRIDGKWLDGNSDAKASQSNTGKVNVELMKYKIEQLEKQLAESNARYEGMKDSFDNVVLTLAAPKEASPSSPEAPRKSLFSRMFS